MERAITETESRKMQIVASATQSFFLHRFSDSDPSEIELNADSKLFLLENAGVSISHMPLGMLSAFHFQTSTFLPGGGYFESDALVYRPNDSNLSARLRFQGLGEDFEPGHLAMVIWSTETNRAGLINLTALSELRLMEHVRGFLEGEPFSGKTPSEVEVAPLTKPDDYGSQLSASLGKGGREEERRTSSVALGEEPDRPEPLSGGGVFDPILEIWSRAYGGSAAAISPWAVEMSPDWAGPSSPGLAEAEELVRLTLKDPKNQVWMYLVGGPGSGKSTFATQFLRRLGFTIPGDQEMHQRHYLASHAESKNLRFVNDATVRAKGSDEALVKDMMKASESDWHLLTCVNRGVIADELNLLDDKASELAQILNWIVHGPGVKPPSLDSIAEHEYLQIGKLANSSGGFRYVVVVFMDTVSLLENQPNIYHNGTFESLRCDKLTTREAEDDGMLGSSNSPFSQLLQKVSHTVNPQYLISRFGLSDGNPIIANATQLQDQDFRAGLLSILRVSEIKLGSRMNYRALWSLVARFLFGDLPSRVDFDGLQGALAEIDENVSHTSDFGVFLQLINLRTTEAIFENTTELSSVSSFDPGLKFSLSVDPALCASGQIGKSSDRTSNQSVFVKPIAHAFQSAEVGEGILETISVQTGNPLPHKRTTFDSKIDSVFAMARGADSPERLSNEQVARYSRYLLRISSVFGGIALGQREAQEWVSLWNFSPHIPQRDQFPQRIDTLLKPRVGRGGLQESALITLLESRARPIIQTSESEPILARAMDNLQFSTSKVGSDLFLVLQEYNQELGRIKLDFSFLRELLNTSQFSVGVTEETFFVTPRLERTRSIKLISSNSAGVESFAIVVGDRVRTGVAVAPRGTIDK